MWQSDGTEEGTVLVQDIYEGNGSSDLEQLTNIDGTLYFTASDSTHGTELWKLDVQANPINGTNSNDTLTGSTADDKIEGKKGDDFLQGCGGNDTLCGCSGNDMLAGGTGDDKLFAGTGSDTLSGGAGNDTLKLGKDTDTDIVKYAAGNGADTIYNFVRGEGGDRLMFAGIDYLDITTTDRKTEFCVGDGVENNSGFGKGELLVSISGTIGLSTEAINVNLFSTGQFFFS